MPVLRISPSGACRTDSLHDSFLHAMASLMLGHSPAIWNLCLARVLYAARLLELITDRGIQKKHNLLDYS